MTDDDALIASLPSAETIEANPAYAMQWCLHAADRIAALTAERDAAQELATRSTRRLVELTEPGSIGAFAARDAALERATRAEAEAALAERRARITKEWEEKP